MSKIKVPDFVSETKFGMGDVKDIVSGLQNVLGARRNRVDKKIQERFDEIPDGGPDNLDDPIFLDNRRYTRDKSIFL